MQIWLGNSNPASKMRKNKVVRVFLQPRRARSLPLWSISEPTLHSSRNGAAWFPICIYNTDKRARGSKKHFVCPKTAVTGWKTRDLGIVHTYETHTHLGFSVWQCTLLAPLLRSMIRTSHHVCVPQTAPHTHTALSNCHGLWQDDREIRVAMNM